MRSIGAERFRFEEKEHAVIGETTGGVFRLGMAVKVKLAEAAPLTGGLRFEMLSDPLPGAPRRKGSGAPSAPGRGRKNKAKAAKGKTAAGGKSGAGRPKRKRSKGNAKARRG